MYASTIGNVGHALNIIFIVIYASIVFFFGQQKHDNNFKTVDAETRTGGRVGEVVLDQRWEEDGFCRPHGTDIIQTHIDSGLVLTVILFLFITFLYSKQTHISKTNAAEMEIVHNYVIYALIGVMGHACGHFLISSNMANGNYPEWGTRRIDDLKESSIAIATLKILPGYLCFWIPLLKSYMQNAQWPAIFVLAAFGITGSVMIPVQLGFSFAQCYFFLGLNLDQLFFERKEKKTFAYTLYPFVTVLPSAILSILECVRCSSPGSIWAEYGHVMYDLYMGLSYPLFYAVCAVYYKDGRHYSRGMSSSPPTIKHE